MVSSTECLNQCKTVNLVIKRRKLIKKFFLLNILFIICYKILCHSNMQRGERHTFVVVDVLFKIVFECFFNSSFDVKITPKG